MGVEPELELVGLTDLIGMLTKMASSTVPLLGRALYEEGQLAFRQSQVQVPFRYGVLKGSGRIFPPEIHGDHVDVSLGYGGAASAYALYTHNHDLHFKNGKKSHYLSDPVASRVPGMDARLLKRIEAVVKRGELL